jgi:hypothetical protein
MLRACRRISAGQELLVDYHITYWLSRRKRAGLSGSLRHWLQCVAVLQEVLSHACNADLEEYVSSEALVQDDGTIMSVHHVKAVERDSPNCLCSMRIEIPGHLTESGASLQDMLMVAQCVKSCVTGV